MKKVNKYKSSKISQDMENLIHMQLFMNYYKV